MFFYQHRNSDVFDSCNGMGINIIISREAEENLPVIFDSAHSKGVSSPQLFILDDDINRYIQLI